MPQMVRDSSFHYMSLTGLDGLDPHFVIPPSYPCYPHRPLPGSTNRHTVSAFMAPAPLSMGLHGTLPPYMRLPFSPEGRCQVTVSPKGGAGIMSPCTKIGMHGK